MDIRVNHAPGMVQKWLGAISTRMPITPTRGEGNRAKSYRHARPGAPQLMEWGTQDIVIQDPSGNRLCFYSAGPDA